MFELYEQGLGTHAIAKKTGRSTHTVYGVLTHRNTRSLPERPLHPGPEAGKTRGTKTGKRTRRPRLKMSLRRLNRILGGDGGGSNHNFALMLRVLLAA